MRKIKKLVTKIDEELKDAKNYAYDYVEKKEEGSIYANKYKEMAQDELKHANYLHDMTVAEIEEARKIYTPPEAMLEAWEHEHREYIEEVAHIKQILTM